MASRTVILAHMQTPTRQQVRCVVAIAPEELGVNDHGEVEPDRFLAGGRTGDADTVNVCKTISDAFGTPAPRCCRQIEFFQLLNPDDRANLHHLAVEARDRTVVAAGALPEIPDRSGLLHQVLVIRANAPTLHRVERLSRIKTKDLRIAETADAMP